MVAARRLNLVQSGLSVAIKEMEEELGTRLVNRTTRSVALTHAGELLLEYARSSLAMLNDGIQTVRSQDGVVRGRVSYNLARRKAGNWALKKVDRASTEGRKLPPCG
jgi:DNA-binding transcriptional LysR family regulator